MIRSMDNLQHASAAGIQVTSCFVDPHRRHAEASRWGVNSNLASSSLSPYCVTVCSCTVTPDGGLPSRMKISRPYLPRRRTTILASSMIIQSLRLAGRSTGDIRDRVHKKGDHFLDFRLSTLSPLTHGPIHISYMLRLGWTIRTDDCNRCYPLRHEG